MLHGFELDEKVFLYPALGLYLYIEIEAWRNFCKWSNQILINDLLVRYYRSMDEFGGPSIWIDQHCRIDTSLSSDHMVK